MRREPPKEEGPPPKEVDPPKEEAAKGPGTTAGGGFQFDNDDDWDDGGVNVKPPTPPPQEKPKGIDFSQDNLDVTKMNRTSETVSFENNLDGEVTKSTAPAKSSVPDNPISQVSILETCEILTLS